MAVLGKQKLFIFNLSLIIISSCSYRHSVYAQGGPGILFQRAMFCFNNKLIYTGCDEPFRLNESGDIKVPVEATDLFCNGPCLAETEQVLRCVDSIMSDFVFYNRATSRDVRNTLRVGCSSSSRRGNFNVRDYLGGFGFSRAGKKLPSLISIYAPALILGFALLVI